MKDLPWKLYLSEFLTNLLPTIYLTLRVYFLGDLPNAWGVNIASQLVWISLILEVIQEALILPLFYIIGKTAKNRQETINKVKSGLIFTVCVHVIILIIVGIFARFFVELMAQDPRIGVVVCSCGTNIAGTVDVDEVTKYASSLPNVVYAENLLYSCSSDAQVVIKDAIKEHKLNRVIVASCTPRTHEPLFRGRSQTRPSR